MRSRLVFLIFDAVKLPAHDALSFINSFLFIVVLIMPFRLIPHAKKNPTPSKLAELCVSTTQRDIVTLCM